MAHLRTEDGRHTVVRNGHLPARDLVMGTRPVRIQQSRVRAKRCEQKCSSRILRPYLRRVPSVDELSPFLYLKGISTGDFSEALEAIYGPQVVELSATNIVRLKED